MNSRWTIVYGFLIIASQTSFPQGNLMINEFMASNIHVQLNSDSSDFVDWIELYNAGDTPIELGGMFLKDDFASSDKWTFPSGAMIPPKSFFIIWADGLDQENHASFKLSKGGEQIGLYYPDGAVIDTISFDKQVDDISFGRFPDGADEWQFFIDPTCGAPNITSGISSNLQAPYPVFSLTGGMYTGEIPLKISAAAGTTIRFTTDGSLPGNNSSVYTVPIDVDSSMVIRARAIQENRLPSDIITNTYIINDPTLLPVIAITTPPEFLWDEDIGITVGICVSDELGAPPPFDPNANFWNKWERPVHLEYFTPDGMTGLDQDAGIAIFGGFFGRQIRQKAFTLYARDKYGDADFDYPLFPTKSINSFKRFLLRCSSNDFNRTYFRDAMMNTLVIGQMDIDYQAYQPAMVYINGKFWGMYNIREKTNQFYPESNYGIDTDSVDLIEGIESTAHGDGALYQALLQYVSEHDMTLEENYQYVQTQMDITEFMNYYITEIYVCNRDWLHQNIKCWREHGQDGKWRWLLYDLDWGFSGEYNLGTDQFTDNTVQWVLEQGPASALFQHLLENHAFKEEFAQRFITHLNLTFNPERVHSVITSMQEYILPEMPRQIDRWGAIKSLEYWNEQLEILHIFAENRPFYMYVQLAETILSEEKRELILEISNPDAGMIKVYDVPCPFPTYSGQWYMNLPIQISAQANPGWRFVRWEGTFPSDSASQIVRLQDNAIMFAVYEPYSLPKIVISEIHYNPSFDLQGDDNVYEFVELFNNSSYSIDLSNYRFNTGIDFTFPQGSTMKSGEYIILAKTLETYAGKGFQVFQITEGKLNNAGEELLLSDQNGEIIDRVFYDDHIPWPEEPDGKGPSLELTDPSLDNSLASSWRASGTTGGTPGAGDFTDVITLHRDPQIKLFPPWPNPFTHTITFSYSISSECIITLKLFNASGQEVAMLVNEKQMPGIHEISWELVDLPKGLYLVYLSSGLSLEASKILYLP